MRVAKLQVEQLRNLEHVELEPHARFNIFEGRNGQGKTNLLEAVYLLAAFKSFRRARNRELIRWGEASALVRGEVIRKGLERTVGLEITGAGRRAALDGKVVTSLSSVDFSHLSVVFFGPDDLALTKHGPAERRRFLDRAVFNVWPVFLDEAQRFVRALHNRNRLLKQHGRAGSPDPDILASFEIELARRGARVWWRRLGFISSYRPYFERALAEMTDGALAGALRYHSGVDGAFEGASEGDLEAAFTAAIDKARERDRARGHTTVGPHTDDLVFELGDRDVRRFASQGQHRAYVLALKIAELQRIEAALGVCPVLLLDDVSSELDEQRNADLMRFLDRSGGQVFITTTDRRWIHLTSASTAFRVDAGAVIPP